MSEDVKPTPGPWRVEQERIAPDDIRFDVVAGLSGEVLVACPPSEADARLIAAAPDMLAALKALWADRDVRQSDQAACKRLYEAWRALRAAIAKAEGEP